MKKFLSFVLSLSLCMSLMPTAFADDTTHVQDNRPTANINITVFYEMDGENIVEHIAFPEDNISVIRTIHPDNTMTVETVDDRVTQTVVIDSDYSIFQKMYWMQENPMPYNNDITGSQYIHQYVGSPDPVTIYASTIRAYRDAAKFAGLLFTLLGNVPAMVVSCIAEYVFDRILENSDCYKVVITSDTYQVLFAVDNSYYIHCYHEKIEYYKENAKKPYDTDWDYYQAIGG